MDLGLSGQTAVIIGGAKGIGRAIAESFAAEGSQVAVLDLDSAVEGTASEIAAAHGVATMGHVLDATAYDATRDAADKIAGELGGYHHVVYSAGVGSGKYGFPFWNLEPSDWDFVLRVNLVGAVNAAHAFAPRLVEQRAGTMLFLSSIAGQMGSQTDPPYSAAKAGVINFAQCAAKDLAEYDVRVNTICPGMVQTTVNRSVWQAWHDQQPEDQRLSYDEWAGEKVSRVAPLRRWQTGEDIGNLAVFLASPRAKNITGQTMNVDGGQIMHW